MTKVYEEVLRGTITEVLKRLTAEVKGEVTVMLEGNTRPQKPDLPTVADALKHYSQTLGLSIKESVNRVAEDFGISRREVYQESLKMKQREDQQGPAPREE